MTNIETKSKGRFIAFEGIDGSGKSTQVARLKNRLKKLNVDVYETFEPTDSPIGSLIHQIMTGRIKTDHKTIAALFVADRIDHLLNETNGIVKKVDCGTTVLSDRYYFSSYAYHSPHMDMNWVIEANAINSDVLRPDMNIFIDISPETGIKRINQERSHLELYERLDKLEEVRAFYFEAFEKLQKEESIVVINGESHPDDIESQIWEKVKHFFPEN